MIKIEASEKCSGCGACAAACPENCISMESDSEGFLYPKVDANKCIDCGICERICPIINRPQTSSKQSAAFAVKNLDDEVRNNSSSGGLFTLLAEKVLENGGAVYGAAFSDGFRSVRHIRVDRSEDLKYLRGSKYLQSETGTCYVQAREDLDAGKPVLFTGTPCQIGGLYAYLEKDYPHLYTQDIICHGVPSPRVWAKYVEHRENTASAKTEQVSFRNKKYGWKTFSVQFEFEGCPEYIELQSNDLFMRGFLADLYLRPSCHSCAYKGLHRQADITLADFWGIDRLMPEIDDDKGISLVFIHSEKGRRLFEDIKPRMDCKRVAADAAIVYNPAAVSSVKPHPKREYFFRNFENEPLPDLIAACLRLPLLVRVKLLIKRILQKTKRILKFGRTI